MFSFRSNAFQKKFKRTRYKQAKQRRRPRLALESLETRLAMSTLAPGPDFNGDNFDDLAVGAPSDNSGAGSVTVIYGSPSGLADNSHTQIWEQGFNLEGSAEPADHLGSSLAWGDFNHDNFDDLAIGVPGETINGQMWAGAVEVLYGSRAGLQTPIRNTSVLQVAIWHQGLVFGGSSILDQAELADCFGQALAAGDFNADGFQDLAIGAPYEDLGMANGIRDAGLVTVLYGSRSGLSFNQQLWSQDSSMGGIQIMDQAEKDDRFGMVLAAGDFNGDHKDDLAIGVPWEDIGAGPTGVDAGVVQVIYAASGRGTGLDPTANQILHQGQLFLDPFEAGDHFGEALAAGDFGRGPEDDLAIGVPLEDVGSLVDAGAVQVIYATTSGLDIFTTQFWNQGSPGMAGDGAETGDRFGAALCAASFDGTTKVDLAIGVPGEDIGSILDAGAVNVLYTSVPGAGNC